ncbi:MAG: ABC transporter ATP-binding protein [Devosia sp.]|nr:ABC transporter ATP-binding protein [Devosia sp.]
MPSIRAERLYKFFHAGEVETIALRGVSLSIEPGEFVALVGPSGSGKSTLLSCLAGLEEPDGGLVDLMDERMSHRSEAERTVIRGRHLGIIMQSGNLFDHLTLRENVAFERHLMRSDANVVALLSSVGLAARANARPSQLSGGEAARAAVCVALAGRPAVLLCDEPTAEVDHDNEGTIIALLKEQTQRDIAVLVATHSAYVASQADRVVTMRDGALI